MIEIRMEDIEAYFDQVEALQAENERLERRAKALDKIAHESVAELAAARRVVQAVEDLTTEAECRAGYLTAPGWREKAVKTSDLRAALAGPGPTDDERPATGEHR